LSGACIDVSGLVRDFRFTAANLRAIDQEELRQICLQLSQIARSINSSSHIWLVGAAGANDMAAVERLKAMLRLTDKFCEEIEVYPDYICNHAACLGGKDGILSINGTGSVLFGVHQTISAKMGGWGYLIDETPSAAYFGRRAVESILRYLDGEPGFEAFVSAWQKRFEPPDRSRIIDELYRSPGIQKRLGQYAPVLTDAFAAGSLPAATIIIDSALKLVETISRLMQKLQAGTASACGSGGLWYNWAPFADIVEKACRQQKLALTWQPRQYELAIGPLLMHAKEDFASADLIKHLQHGAAK
jgi:N-acetylglucosamine kinase-like BadF-type ATPase